MRMGTGIYVKNSAAAVPLYCEASGLELGYHVRNPDGSFFHSELNRGGQEMFDVIESAEETQPGNVVQVNIILDDEDAVRKAFALLSDGGTVELPPGPLPWSPCGAALHDKFGVWWYISAPQHYPDADYDPAAPVAAGGRAVIPALRRQSFCRRGGLQ